MLEAAGSVHVEHAESRIENSQEASNRDSRERSPRRRDRRRSGRATVHSFALCGIDALPVEVQVAAESGYPSIALVGLPDTAVRESRERIQAAFKGLDAKLNERRFTVNLAPAELRKEGASFDLPIALGLLIALKKLRSDRLSEVAVAGELALDGTIRPIRGALAHAIAARRCGCRGLILPAQNLEETAGVRELAIYPARSLPELVQQLVAGSLEAAVSSSEPIDCTSEPPDDGTIDLRWVRGQSSARRALEIAAAGAHNLLLVGPPGSGKTLLARCLPGILPPLSPEEALEVTLVHSVAGRLQPGTASVRSRPFRAPHHTITGPGLVGGGLVPRPGEVSLAHFGVLFLDEMPEFRPEVLNLLRQPVEEGALTLVRLQRSVRIPCRFMLVGAMNPCPCGHLGNPRRGCRCTESQIKRYQGRISRPLLDRIDLQAQVPALSAREITNAEAASGEESSTVRARVTQARQIQTARFSGRTNLHANAQMTVEDLERECPLLPAVRALLQSAMDRLGLSARAAHRAIRVARTIADLAGCEGIETPHLAEAVSYRGFDTPREET